MWPHDHRGRPITTLGAVLLLAGGGGGSPSNSNESKIERARASEASAAQIHAKLERSLQLHSYAGVDDSFTLPPGSPDVHLGKPGEECSIGLIEVGRAAVQAYSASSDALVSPDTNAVVKVGYFVDTPESDCLEAVRKALGW